MVDSFQAIKSWELKKSQDYYDLAKFIIRNWKYDDYISLRGRKFKLSTGGWSGNEEVMSALDQNKMFNMVCWESSKRGGHFVYELPKKSIV